MLDTCIILNGPPGCGKDTIAEIICNDHNFHHMMMKNRLYSDTAKFFNVDYDEFIRRATDRKLKESEWEKLELVPVSRHNPFGYCVSPREALIFTSERVLKPLFGEDYFGKAAADACRAAYAQLAVFSDGGFASEIAPLKAAYKSLFIFRLHRADYSFMGDSRRYLPGGVADNVFDIHLVEGDPQLAADQILCHLPQYNFAALA